MSEASAQPTVGSIDEKDGEIKINREFFRQGYIYKNTLAFKSGKGTCYAPETSDSMYTRKDFIDMCNGQEDIAKEIFESVDWQHPETYIDEQFVHGEITECESCHKWFWCYGADRCPHCDHPYKEETE